MESSDTKTETPNLPHNLSWAISAKFIELLSGLISGILIARGLKEENYGLYTYILAFYSIFYVLCTFGLEPLLIRELSKTNRNRSTFLGSAFILQLGIIFLLIPLILLFFWSCNESFEFKTGGTILALSSLFVFDRFFHSLLVADLKNQTDGTIQVITKSIFFFIKVIIFLWHPTLLLFLWILFTENGFRLLLYLSIYQKRYSKSIKKWRFDYRIAKIILYNAFPLLSASILTILFQRVDLIMIGSILSKGTCGQYSIATISLAIIIFIPLMICQTIYPVLVKNNKSNQKKFNNQIVVLFNATFWYSVLISIIAYFVLPILLKTIYGNEYETAANLSRMVVWQVPFICMTITSDQWIIIKNLQYRAPIRHTIGLIINILLNLILLPTFGIIGSAVSSIVAYLFSGYLCNYFISPLRELWILQNQAMRFSISRKTIQKLFELHRKSTISINLFRQKS